MKKSKPEKKKKPVPSKGAAKKPAKPAEAETPVYGPYELVDGVNRIMFGADPVIRIGAGEEYTTEDATVAARLDAHAQVKKAG